MRLGSEVDVVRPERRSSKRWRAGAAAGVALSLGLALAGCGGSASDEGGGSEKATIRVVNGVTSFEFMAASMAEELGVWDDLGLDVKYIAGTGGGGQVTTTLEAGQADIGLHGGGAAAVSIAQGQSAKIVAVTSPSFSGFPCVVRKDSDITSYEDLKGKTMGISSAGSLTDLVGRLIAKKYGWELGKDFKQAKIGDLSQLTAALSKGVVDVICWSAEPAMTLVDKGEGRLLPDTGEVVGPNIYEAVEATDDAIANKKDEIELYLKGYFQTVQYMKDHPDETVKFLAKYAGLDEKVAQDVYDLRMGELSLDGTATTEMLDGVLNSVAILGSGKDTTAPSVDDVWDGSFVPVSAAK